VQNSFVQFTDVTLRDGLQSETISLDTPSKLLLGELLLSCGFSRLELTSFSHPKWIPQLSDSDQFCEAFFKSQNPKSTELMAFVPNEKGLERFLKHPIEWASLFTAASDSFHQKNVNLSIQDGLNQIEKLVKRLKLEKRRIRIYLSTVFGCPYEKEISVEQVSSLVKKIASFDPDEIALSDTIGVASPSRVKKVLEVTSTIYPKEKTALHFHDTYGMGLANVQAAYQLGIRRFDGSTGGIGGCPYAKGASGNLALETLAYFFERQGYRSGVNWEQIRKTLRCLSQNGLSLQSHLASIFLKGGEWYGIS